jgi:SSS family solute:Na+ symporter
MGVALAITSASIVALLTIFYSLLTASLFVPILGGLYVRKAASREALAAIAAGVGGMLFVQFSTAGKGFGLLTPAPAGLVAACAAFTIVLAARGGAAAETLGSTT